MNEKKAATSKSWKTEPFGATIEIPYSGEFPLWEFARLRMGLIPQAMEDKWFIYFERDQLHLHRSWTGMAIYRVTFERRASMHVVSRAEKALLKGEDGNPRDVDLTGEAATLDFLISNLLLGKNKPFPVPSDISDDKAALYQHHISGTGYPTKKG